MWGQRCDSDLIVRWRTHLSWSITIILGLLLFAACGDEDASGGAGGTEQAEAACTATGNAATVTAAAAMTETSVGPIPTLAPIPPTVTPGGFPWGEAGIVIDGTVTMTGGAEVQQDFHVIQYGMGSPQACTESVQGVSK